MRAPVFGMLLLVAACARDGVDVAAIDAWRGDWHGPEGTLLTIAGGQGDYRVTVRDLDGPAASTAARLRTASRSNAMEKLKRSAQRMATAPA